MLVVFEVHSVILIDSSRQCKEVLLLCASCDGQEYGETGSC